MIGTITNATRSFSAETRAGAASHAKQLRVTSPKRKSHSSSKPKPTTSPTSKLSGLIVASDPGGMSDSTLNIYVMRPDGSDKCYLTLGGYVNTLASWSYDGKKIVYLSNQSGNGEIWIMDANGQNHKQLTISGAITSAFSPDGK